MISVNDRLIIYEIISLHGHIVDEGRFDELNQIFSSDVVYDLEDFGLGSLHGIAAIKDSAITLGSSNPVGHHITNIVLSDGEDEFTVYAKSKGIGIKADGTCGSVTYEDILKKRDNKWQIVYRKVIARPIPLEASRKRK